MVCRTSRRSTCHLCPTVRIPSSHLSNQGCPGGQERRRQSKYHRAPLNEYGLPASRVRHRRRCSEANYQAPESLQGRLTTACCAAASCGFQAACGTESSDVLPVLAPVLAVLQPCQAPVTEIFDFSRSSVSPVLLPWWPPPPC